MILDLDMGYLCHRWWFPRNLVRDLRLDLLWYLCEDARWGMGMAQEKYVRLWWKLVGKGWRRMGLWMCWGRWGCWRVSAWAWSFELRRGWNIGVRNFGIWKEICSWPPIKVICVLFIFLDWTWTHERFFFTQPCREFSPLAFQSSPLLFFFSMTLYYYNTLLLFIVVFLTLTFHSFTLIHISLLICRLSIHSPTTIISSFIISPLPYRPPPKLNSLVYFFFRTTYSYFGVRFLPLFRLAFFAQSLSMSSLLCNV